MFSDRKNRLSHKHNWWYHTKRKLSRKQMSRFKWCSSGLTLVLLGYFCKRSSEAGLLYPLPGFSIRNAWYPYICYQCIGIDLLYPLIPKWVPLNFMWCHYDVIKSACPHKFGCMENIHENYQKSIFRWKMEFSQDFFFLGGAHYVRKWWFSST